MCYQHQFYSSINLNKNTELIKNNNNNFTQNIFTVHRKLNI